MIEWLFLAGLVAGFLDSMVGGGGVITLPALLASGLPPHAAVASNKVAGTAGSTMASIQYLRSGLLDRKLILVALPFAVLASAVGALVVLQTSATVVVWAIVVAVVAVTAYVLLRPQFGTNETFQALSQGGLYATVALAIAAGFYDGFLGPGTGSFLLVGLVAIHGFGFLRASVHGRILNWGSNVGALALFAWLGPVDWSAAFVLALGTMTGAFFGARFNLKHGKKWLRPIFVAVAVALLIRLLSQTL